MCSLYIKALGFETRDPQLKARFESVVRKLPELVNCLNSVKAARKRGSEGRESEQLSMGFRFAEFARAEDALKAVRVAQNIMLGGHVLILQESKRSNREVAGDVRGGKRSNAKAKPRSKFLLCNVEFEATHSEV